MTYEEKVQALRRRLKLKAKTLPWNYRVNAESYETTLMGVLVVVTRHAIRLHNACGDEIDSFDSDPELYAEINRDFHEIDAILDEILAYLVLQ